MSDFKPWLHQPSADLTPPMPVVQAVDLNTDTNIELRERCVLWGQFAVHLYAKDFNFQLIKQQIISLAIEPTTLELIPAAEKSLVEMKARTKILTEDRKTETSKFDDISAKLMSYEKECGMAINALEQRIINKKREKKAEDDKKENKIKELRTVSEHAANAKAQAHAFFLSTILGIISDAYRWCLTDGNIAPNQVQAILSQVEQRIDATIFQPVTFTYRSQYDQQAAVQEAINAAYSEFWQPEQYKNHFLNEWLQKFSDYEVAFNNKVDALSINDQETQAASADIVNEQANQQVANKMEAASVSLAAPAEPMIDTKALKSLYEVVGPESLDDALKICAAFAANKDKAASKLKVTKWGAFTISQMANALAKLKCDDNAFQPTGIVFKEVNKL